MDDLTRSALWAQFGAAIDMFGSALEACPDALWRERIWTEEPPEWSPRTFQ